MKAIDLLIIVYFKTRSVQILYIIVIIIIAGQ
jgi:hypothetical protein